MHCTKLLLSPPSGETPALTLFLTFIRFVFATAAAAVAAALGAARAAAAAAADRLPRINVSARHRGDQRRDRRRPVHILCTRRLLPGQEGLPALLSLGLVRLQKGGGAKGGAHAQGDWRLCHW